MKRIVIGLCFFLLALVGLFFGEYRREMTVQVISEDHYVVPNAHVYFTNSLNYIDGKITSRPILTNESGMATYTLFNNDFDLSKMDTGFTVDVYYGNTAQSFVGDALKTPSPMVVKMPLYGVRFTLLNEEGLPAAGAFVEAKNLRFIADSNGFLFAILPKGKQTISTIYNGIKKTQEIDVTQGASYTFKIYEYRTKLKLIDSFGNPLAGKAYLGNKEYDVPEQGAVLSFGDDVNPIVRIIHGEKEAQATVSFTFDKEIVISFDNEKPVIKDVKATFNDTLLYVRATIIDPGKYASGIKEAYLYYETENDQGKVPMYVERLDTYAAYVRLKNNTRFIDYTIEFFDREGNKDLYEDKYRETTGQESVSSEGSDSKTAQSKSDNSSEKEVSNSGSASVSGNKQQPSQGLNPIMFAILGLIVLVVAYFIYKKMVS